MSFQCFLFLKKIYYWYMFAIHNNYISWNWYIYTLHFLFIFCRFHIIRENMQYLSFWVWFVLFNIMISSSVLLQMKEFRFSLWLNLLHCVYIPHGFYSFIYWWAPRLLPYLANCRLCHNKNGYPDIPIVCWL